MTISICSTHEDTVNLMVDIMKADVKRQKPALSRCSETKHDKTVEKHPAEGHWSRLPFTMIPVYFRSCNFMESGSC